MDARDPAGYKEGVDAEILRLLAAPFFAQGCASIKVSRCCGRLYAGRLAPKSCRVCGRVPAAVDLEAGGDPASALEKLR